MARHVAEQKCMPLDYFLAPVIRFDSFIGEWRVLYERKPPGMPGGFFEILINDTTKNTEFIRGM